jgi:hypothetical protein
MDALAGLFSGFADDNKNYNHNQHDSQYTDPDSCLEYAADNSASLKNEGNKKTEEK